MKRCAKFWKQSVKNFRIFKIIGAPRVPVGHSIKKNIYKNSPVVKMYYKITYTVECNVVSVFKQSAENFSRFKILRAPKGPRDCLNIFVLYYIYLNII